LGKDRRRYKRVLDRAWHGGVRDQHNQKKGLDARFGRGRVDPRRRLRSR
jgi:hypothetical protein